VGDFDFFDFSGDFLRAGFFLWTFGPWLFFEGFLIPLMLFFDFDHFFIFL